MGTKFFPQHTVSAWLSISQFNVTPRAYRLPSNGLVAVELTDILPAVRTAEAWRQFQMEFPVESMLMEPPSLAASMLAALAAEIALALLAAACLPICIISAGTVTGGGGGGGSGMVLT